MGEEPCQPCKDAQAKYNKRRNLNIERGLPSTIRDLIPMTGTLRRIQALMTLGWPLFTILDKAGLPRRSLYHYLNGERINRDHAKKVEKVYRQLMLREPTTKEARQQAITITKRRAADSGWPGPMDWVDIDRDPFPVVTKNRKKDVA